MRLSPPFFPKWLTSDNFLISFWESSTPLRIFLFYSQKFPKVVSLLGSGKKPSISSDLILLSSNLVTTQLFQLLLTHMSKLLAKQSYSLLAILMYCFLSVYGLYFACILTCPFQFDRYLPSGSFDSSNSSTSFQTLHSLGRGNFALFLFP